MRITVGTAIACVALAGISTAHDAEAAAIRSKTDIPPQALAPALRTLVKERDIQLVYRSELIGDQQTGGASGDLTPVEALGQLLDGTGLTYKYLDDKTITILPAGAEIPAAAGARISSAGQQTSRAENDGKGAQKSSFWDRFRLAQAGHAVAAGTSSVEPVESSGLQEVTVTAQRREENSQRVPISIATVSGEDARLRGTIGVETLSTSVPNLTSTGTSGTSIFIRGVGNTSASPNNEPSAATYVDGVYMPSISGLRGFAFNNIERIEVLKGPQGTLFGRNSTAGVVQIITPNPQHELGGNLSLGYGAYQTVSGNAYLTGGITENVAADLSVLYDDQGTGWGHNLTTGEEIYKHRDVAARSKWLYTPAEATRVVVSFDYSKYESNGGTQMAPGSVNPTDHVTVYPGRYNAVGDSNGNLHKQYGASVRLDQDFGSLHGVSITSYRNVSGDIVLDNDRTPQRRSHVDSLNDSDYVTEELQLSNLNPGRVTWLAGAFLYGNTVHGTDPRIETGTNISPGQYREIYGRQRSRSYSAFAQATAELVTNTKLTLGLRYTDETLKADGRFVNAAGVTYSGPFVDEISFAPWTWRVALDHQFSDDLLTYVSYNRGFKSGGYNLNTPGGAPFFPETVDAYEVGMKSEFLDHHARLNVAAFYYDYKNMQVIIVPGGAGQIFTNAAAARNYGLDASLELAATANLTLSTGIGLLDAKYKDYPDAQGYTITGARFPIANAKGNDLPYAPQFSGFVSANYRVPTAIGAIKAAASLSYTDKAFIGPDEGFFMPDYFTLSSSVEWWSQDPHPIGVRLWGRNLTNSYTFINRVESTGGWYQIAGNPREYGLTVLKNF